MVLDCSLDDEIKARLEAIVLTIIEVARQVHLDVECWIHAPKLPAIAEVARQFSQVGPHSTSAQFG